MTVPNVRVEVAFSSVPDDPAPAWEDVTQWVDLSAGISITRGRQDEFSQAQAATCSLVLDNSDGRFTSGLSSSPYYPNVKFGRKIRVFTGDTAYNLLDGDSATFEGGTIGDWSVQSGVLFPGTTTATASTTRARDGSRSMSLTWSTASANQCAVALLVGGFVVGTTYTISAYVYVPAGSPVVKLGNPFTTATASTTTGAWERLSYSFTPAGTAAIPIYIFNGAASTAGQGAYVDSVMLNVGATPSTFVDHGARPRFTGYVDEWPVEFAPTGRYAVAQVTATDRLKRLGQVSAFSNVVFEEVSSDSPLAYYPLGEPEGATSAGDLSGRGMPTLSVTQIGSGGTIAFGAGTGPGTDGLTAPVFTAASSSNGKYLSGSGLTTVSGWSAATLRVAALTSGTADATAASIASDTGSISLGFTAAGKVVGSGTGVGGVTFSITSASSFNDGRTHDLVVTVAPSSGATLYVDGVSVGTAAYADPALTNYTRVRIGSNGSAGTLFSGTLSHVAVYEQALSASRVADYYSAVSTGFAGESSDRRIARYARWAGVSTADLNLEAGSSTSIAHVDTTGASPLQAMQDVAATESGVLFIAGDGRLTFHSRSHRYSASTSMTLAEIGVGDKFVVNDQQLVNEVTASRDGGIKYRAVSSDSVTDYGSYRQDITLLTTSDNEVVDAANWIANSKSEPQPRLPQLTIDLLTNVSVQSSALALEIGSLVALSNLPAQAPSGGSLFVEGWTETVSTREWSLACNTSPAGQTSVWVLDDSVFSVLGQTTTLAY